MDKAIDYIENNFKKIITIFIAFILSICLISSSIYSVKDYETAVVTRFGRIVETTGSGFHFKIPFSDTVYKANHRIKNGKTELSTYVQDGSNSVEIYYDYSYELQKGDVSLRNTFNNFGDSFDISNYLVQRIHDATRNIVSNYAITEVNNKRGELKNKVKQLVNQSISKYGYILQTASIGVEYGEAYQRRLDSVKLAQAKTAEEKQRTLQETFKAERETVTAKKEANLAKIKADKERYVRETAAAAEANSVSLESKAKADAIRREGEAKAAAQTAQNKALKSSQDLIGYKLAEAELKRAEAMGNWEGGVPTQVITGNGGKLPIFPFMNAMKGISK